MAAYDSLKSLVQQAIRTNGNNEITGQVLQNVLMAMIDELGGENGYAGVATPSTNPGAPDGKVFYFGTEAGTYTHFDGATLAKGIHLLVFNGVTWSHQTLYTIDSEVTSGSNNLITSGAVYTKIVNAINALDATVSKSAGADGLSLSLTETDGKVTSISGSIAPQTYDAYGAASAAQIAASTDATNKVNAAKTQILGGAASDYNTLGKLEDKIQAEASRAAAAENALNTDKAEKATTLAGYGINDAYTKTEVNGLVSTPHQNYVTVPTYASLPATGSADTIYRVSNYNGSTSQVDASVYSEYAWNGSGYTFLRVVSQIGEVFDITVYNSNTKYADLAAALGTNGANVPSSIRRGGMSVKFVQSSDNKYVQYRLMKNQWSTTVSDWEGVDEEPTIGSKNLVKSGGVDGTNGKIIDKCLLKKTLFPRTNIVQTINGYCIYNYNFMQKDKYDIVIYQVSDWNAIYRLEKVGISNVVSFCFLSAIPTPEEYGYILKYQIWGSTWSSAAPNNYTTVLPNTVKYIAVTERHIYDVYVPIYTYEKVEIDSVPTENSDNLVESGGVYTSLDGKQDALTFDDVPTSGSNNPVKSGGIKNSLDSIESQIEVVKSTFTKNSLIKEKHIGEYNELNTYAYITQNYPGDHFFSNVSYGMSIVDYTMDLNFRPNANTFVRLCFAIPFETFDDLDFKVTRKNCYLKDDLGGVYDTTNFYIAYLNTQDWGSGDGIGKVNIVETKTLKEIINGSGVQEIFKERLLAAKVAYIFVATGSKNNLSEGATKVTVHGELYKVFNGTVLATDATDELKDEIKAYIEGDTPTKYKLISLGDSLSTPVIWQNRVKNVIPNLIDAVSDISAGGTGSAPSSKQNGFFRVLRLVNDSLIQDNGEHTIVIMENVNDVWGVPQNVDTAIAEDKAVMPKDVIESDILKTEFTSANLDTIPQNKRTIGAFLQVLTIANGKKLTITNAPTTEGDVRLVVGWLGGSTTVNVHVVPQATEAATIEYVKEKILEYDYSPITDIDGGNSSILFSLGNNAYETIVQFTDIDNTGMTCTIEAVSDAHGTSLKYFNGTSLSDWTDTTKWVDASSLSLTSAYKGIVQYILTNFPKCHIIMAGFPRHSVTPSTYQNADGTYNVETWKQTEFEVMGDNLIAYQEKIAKLFNIPFVNIDRDINITLSNLSTFYNNNNVHPKTVGYTRIGDVMAANIKKLSI